MDETTIGRCLVRSHKRDRSASRQALSRSLPLAPLFERATQRAFHRVGCLAAQFRNVSAGDAAHLDAYDALNLFLAHVDRRGDGSKAVIRQRLALLQNVFGGVSHRETVHVDDACFPPWIAEANAASESCRRIAVLAQEDIASGDARRLGEARMGTKVGGLAMHRQKCFGCTMDKTSLSSSAPHDRKRAPCALLVIDFAADLRKRVHHARHRFLVAGNRRCRDDDRIALVDLNGAMARR